MKKQCKSCMSQIDVKAIKCPKCGADQRNWFMKHKILTGIAAVILLFIVLGIIGSSGSSTGNALKSGYQAGQQAGSGNSGPSHDDLMKQNNPDIKHLSTLTADYVGKSFTLYVNAEDDNYYNYGYQDQNSYYSLKIWDSSVSGDFGGVYAYIDKSDPNSKVLVNKIINGATFLKVQASIPTATYEDGSNAFLHIDSWQEVK